MRVKTEERRQAIIEVAREAFTAQGFENTSMAEIASRVGGSKATLYNSFSSKEELFAAVIDEFGKQKIADAFTSLQSEQPINEQLLRLGEHYLQFRLTPEVLGLQTIIYHEAGRSAIGREYYQRGPKKGWMLVADYLAGQMQRGRLRQADPWVTAVHLKGLLEAELIEPCVLGAEPMPDENRLGAIVARAIEAFLLAYAPSTAASVR